VGVEQGAPHIAVVGTTARLMDADVLPGGLLGVRVLGERRFRVLAHEPDRRGLLWARVEKLVTDLSSDDSIAAERRERLVAALARLEPALQAAGARHELPWLCHRLAERLPLDLAVRQALLECESVAEMVARVEDWLASTQR
ncbi:MAG TPA: LON peptidase substrate-binding domain-containing protein, partial [Guyparkeria sp.]|nr:LON peptidase substrate-binding domain-containing protein [Guyparkeria sp.]